MVRWMRLAGYFVIISFLLVLALEIATLFGISGFNIHEHLWNILISFFLLGGFLTLGKFSKNNFLIVISWIIFPVSIILSVFSILELVNPSIFLFFITHYSISVNSNTFFLVLLPSGLINLLNIVLGVSLLKLKEIKFSRTAGILAIVIGTLYSIFYLILAPIVLSTSESSAISQFFSNINSYPFLFLATIITIIQGALALIESRMFFTASKKFEK